MTSQLHFQSFFFLPPYPNLKKFPVNQLTNQFFLGPYLFLVNKRLKAGISPRWLETFIEKTTGQPRYLKVQGNGENTSSYPKFDIAKMWRHQNTVYMLNFVEPDFLRYTFAVQT